LRIDASARWLHVRQCCGDQVVMTAVLLAALHDRPHCSPSRWSLANRAHESCCIVAMGIDIDGVKHPLAVVEGSTEDGWSPACW
jgi:hypothetical protein